VLVRLDTGTRCDQGASARRHGQDTARSAVNCRPRLLQPPSATPTAMGGPGEVHDAVGVLLFSGKCPSP